MSDFFWNIIVNADAYKEDIVSTAISKFCDMVKAWDITKKQEFFYTLTDNLENNQASISSIKLFSGLIKDIKERSGDYSSPNKVYGGPGYVASSMQGGIE